MRTPVKTAFAFCFACAALAVAPVFPDAPAAAPRKPASTAADCYAAIRAGDLAGVEAYVEAGGDPGAYSPRGITLFGEACYEGKPEIAAFLAGLGIDPARTNYRSAETNFQMAINLGDTRLLEALLKRGKSAKAVLLTRETVEYALNHGDASTLAFLLDKGADPNERDPLRGDTPLHRLANIRTITVFMPGHLETARKATDLARVKALVERGADPELLNRAGEAVLEKMLVNGEYEVFLYLAGKGASIKRTVKDNPYLLRAVIVDAPDRMDLVEKLVAAGISLEGETAGSWSALHAACSEGRAAIVKYLLGKGARVDAKRADGVTPLMDAFASGSAEIVDALASRGASFSDMTLSGLSCAHYAAKTGNVALARLAVERGSPYADRDAEGKSVLGHCEGDLAMIRYFESLGVGLHNREDRMVFKAAEKGRGDTIRYLAERGVPLDVWVKGPYGETPIVMAMKAKSPDAVRALLENGYDPNLTASDSSYSRAYGIALNGALNRDPGPEMDEIWKMLFEYGIRFDRDSEEGARLRAMPGYAEREKRAKRRVVAAELLNLRKAGSSDAPIRERIPRGTRVEIVREGKRETVGGKAGRWVFVTCGYASGWCHDAYLAPEKRADDEEARG